MIKEVVKQIECSIRTRDNKKITISAKILKPESGPYSASLSHDYIVEPPSTLYIQPLCATLLSELEGRVNNYISSFEEVNYDDIKVNDSF